MAELLLRGGRGSFTGILTYKAADSIRAAAKRQGLERCLLETDAPYLTPVPHRGKPNASYLMPHTVRFMAEHRGVVCSLLAIAGACLWRLWAEHGAALIASAALAGTGVAIIQGLAPGIIKRWFPQRVPFTLGLYSASLMAGGGMAATLSPRMTCTPSRSSSAITDSGHSCWT